MEKGRYFKPNVGEWLGGYGGEKGEIKQLEKE